MNNKILKVAAKFERILTKKALEYTTDQLTPYKANQLGTTWNPPMPDTASTYTGPINRDEDIYNDNPGGEFGKTVGKEWDINDPVASKNYPFQILTTFINRMKYYLEQDTRAIYSPTLKQSFLALKNAIYGAAQKEMAAKGGPFNEKSQLKTQIQSLYSEFFAQVMGIPQQNNREKQVLLGNCSTIKNVLDSIYSSSTQARAPSFTPGTYKPTTPTPRSSEISGGIARTQQEPNYKPGPLRSTQINNEK